MSIKLDLEKAVEDFCNEYQICPNKFEKILLKLAILRGRKLTIEDDIKYLNEQLGG